MEEYRGMKGECRGMQGNARGMQGNAGECRGMPKQGISLLKIYYSFHHWVVVSTCAVPSNHPFNKYLYDNEIIKYWEHGNIFSPLILLTPT